MRLLIPKKITGLNIISQTKLISQNVSNLVTDTNNSFITDTGDYLVVTYNGLADFFTDASNIVITDSGDVLVAEI